MGVTAMTVAGRAFAALFVTDGGHFYGGTADGLNAAIAAIEDEARSAVLDRTADVIVDLSCRHAADFGAGPDANPGPCLVGREEALAVIASLRAEAGSVNDRTLIDAARDSRPVGACGGCGGPHRFDTSVPSPLWNEVIRAAGLSDYLCTSCIVEAFVNAGRSFDAELYGDTVNREGNHVPVIRVQVDDRPLDQSYGDLAERLRERDSRPVGEGLRRAAYEVVEAWDSGVYRADVAAQIKRVSNAIDRLRAALADTGPVGDREGLNVEQLVAAMTRAGLSWVDTDLHETARVVAAEYRRLSTAQPASTEVGEDG